MPQTLMAFLAMMIASIAAFNQLTSRTQSFDDMIQSEYELMANAVVLEQVELIDLGTEYDDLEDWDGAEMERAFTVGDFSITFTLTVNVQFVDEDGVPSEAETNQKEVAVSATQEKFLLPLVTHSRLFSD